MTDSVVQKSKRQLRSRKVRQLLAYWILGICNNYGYVVMLSAAKDILHDHKEAENMSETFFNATQLTSGNADRKCNYMSTGTILLADILPSLLIKFVAPFLPFFVNVRVAFCIILAQVGFVVVAFSTFQWMAILGVIFTSLSAGLGEATFLQYSSYYGKNTVSTWSSGTGAAGVVGASSYIALHKLGLQNALLLMCVIPLLMAFAFWAVLPRPELKVTTTADIKVKSNESVQEEKNVGSSKLSLKEKVSLVPGLFKYMLPLGMVYFLEYFINQGMFELVNFEGIFLDKDEQYRWLQMDYQLGVFISRSSVNLIHIDNIWLMTVFQLLNVIYFTFEALYYLTPSIWIVFAITLWEGTLGGAAYVNTFYKIITKEVDEGEKQFSMGATSFADSIGIALAGISSILVHNRICDMAKPERVSF